VQVTANGTVLPDVVAATVQSNNFFAADRFEIALAVSADDPATMAFWSESPEIEIDVSFRESTTSPYIPAVRGKVDLVSIDPATKLIHAEGRDLSARLIDSVLAETFSNRTASEIAEILARRHGLVPAVTPTPEIIGRYYQGQHDAIMLDGFSGRATEWDFLALLAEMESCDLYVAGSTLYFHPSDSLASPSFVFRPSDLIRLTLERVMTLSGGVQVMVKSWDSRQQRSVVESAARAGSSSAQNQSCHVLIRPNLSPDLARQLAARTLAGLYRHERTVEMVMPGELELTPRDIMIIAETGTAFDQSYQISSIERRFSQKNGFVQRVRASACQPPG
jgi:phage protein D